MKILECSTHGDKRFSALYARVSVYGVYDTIENHYQKCKKDASGNPVEKGKQPNHIVVNNKKLDIKYLTPYYKSLWVKYLDQNKDLVEFLKNFDDFNDKFKGKNTVNCQADVIRQYIKNGRESIINECFDFFNQIR